tara:strand:+ start:95 stop:349 length:255 start_codon:yes stop_codon:yes gene_type:complete
MEYKIFKVVNKKADIGAETRTNIHVARRDQESFEKLIKEFNSSKDLAITLIGIIEAKDYRMALRIARTLPKSILQATPFNITNS